MKWYQMKEQAAGTKRLMLSLFIYKLFGKKVVQLIALCVSFFAFCFSKQIRAFTKKNLSVIFEYTHNEKAKPTFFNQYKNTANYALSLVDRMESFLRKFDVQKIDFDDEPLKNVLIEKMSASKGMIFICSHIGNIEVLRICISNPKISVNPHIDIFLSEEQCKIFNSFLKKIETKTNLTTYPVQNIGIDTAIELKDKIENGDVAFIAGDRLSPGSSGVTFCADFLNKKVNFPAGTFKLAQLMECDIYFISALKEKNDRYKIYISPFVPDDGLSKSANLHKMQTDYIAFLEKLVNIAPLQFYHFYDLFE